MSAFGMWCRVALVRIDVSEERIAYILMVKIINDLGTTIAVTSNCSTLRRINQILILRSVLQLLVTAIVVPSSLIIFALKIAAIRSSETSILTRATRHHIPEDDILHSHRRENFKSYMALTG
jgi:hypothetical protein